MGAKYDRLKQISDGYMERTALMRKLAAPSISEARHAEEYQRMFRSNAVKFRKRYRENAEALQEEILPLLEPDYALDDEEVLFLRGFTDDLQNGGNLEFMDISLLWYVSEKLYRDAFSRDDLSYQIEQMDLRIIACMGKMTQVKCLPDSDELWKEYQEKGAETVEKLLALLEKDAFARIESEDSRELVVINSRYFCVIYDVPGLSRETRDMVIDRLIRSYELADDPFYRELVPGYDWTRHKIKCLEYMGSLTERNNEVGYSREQSERIYPYIRMLEELSERYPDTTKAVFSPFDLSLVQIRSRYYAGVTDRAEFKDQLFAAYKDRKGKSSKTYSIFSDFQLPNECVGSIDRNRLTEEDISDIESIYRNVINDAFQMPSKDTLTPAAEYFARMLDQYIELPGCLSFRDCCVNLLAAVWPQAYVHAFSVAGLTRCFCRHLLNRRPELFIGVCGCRSAGEAFERARDICAFGYYAALVHDIGKIPLIPILSVSERPMFEDEKRLLERYTLIGGHMAEHAISTAPYRNVILQHNLDFDDDRICEEEKAVIDIVALSDAIDEFIQEQEAKGVVGSPGDFWDRAKAGCGTKYAPYFSELFADEAVCRDLEYLLQEGRKNIYRQAYVMLKEVQDRGRL